MIYVVKNSSENNHLFSSEHLLLLFKRKMVQIFKSHILNLNIITTLKLCRVDIVGTKLRFHPHSLTTGVYYLNMEDTVY